MSWLNRRKRELAAVCVEPGRVHALRISRSRGARPTVVFSRTEAVKDDLVATLTQVRTELGLQNLRCTTVMAQGQSRLLVVESPKVPPEEMREAVRWRLTELLEYSPEVAVVDILPMTIDLDGHAHATTMHVVAAERASVALLAAPFFKAGIPLTSVDVVELAMRNVAALFAERGAGVALAWFQSTGSGIVFVANGELCVVRHFDPNLDEALSALASGESRMLERIELGLQRSIDHFERNFSAVPIHRLLLAPFAGAPDLAAHLAAHLSLPVLVADLASVLDLSAAPDLADPARASQMLLSIGAALRSQ
jgi:MSHA biogenesis protein MshI